MQGMKLSIYLLLIKVSISALDAFSCTKTEKCFIDDDASAIVEKMRYADVIVFATPIYSNQMCGSMKTLLDRTNPIFLVDYCFREIYLLTTAAVNDETVPDGAVTGIKGWIECFNKSKLKGVSSEELALIRLEKSNSTPIFWL